MTNEVDILKKEKKQLEKELAAERKKSESSVPEYEHEIVEKALEKSSSELDKANKKIEALEHVINGHTVNTQRKDVTIAQLHVLVDGMKDTCVNSLNTINTLMGERQEALRATRGIHRTVVERRKDDDNNRN